MSLEGLPDSSIQSTTSDGDGAPDEENHLASTEDAEGPAVVLYVGKAEEARYEGDALPDPHRALDDGLYSLVNDEDREREGEGEEQAGPAGHHEAGCISGPLIGGIDPSIPIPPESQAASRIVAEPWTCGVRPDRRIRRVEALERLYLEPGPLDGRDGVSIRVAAAEEPPPQRLHPVCQRAMGPAARTCSINSSRPPGRRTRPDLVQYSCLIRDRAQHERRDYGIEATVREW